MIFRELEEYIAVYWVLQATFVSALILLGLGVLVRRSVSALTRRPLGTGTRTFRRLWPGSGKTRPTTRPTSSG